MVLPHQRQKIRHGQPQFPSARFENYEGSENPYGKEAHSWHALVAELSMIAMGAEAAEWKA